MKVKEIPVPEVYKESADFRFFLNWFDAALSQIKYDTENLLDLYDPQRCPSSLLWLLGATMGYKFDDRMPVAYNRLVLLYFMSMIHTKGSKNGVTLAAEVNLAQFNIEEYGKEKEILYDRLEDTSIPVNAAYVTSNTSKGYIDVVYFSSKLPVVSKSSSFSKLADNSLYNPPRETRLFIAPLSRRKSKSLCEVASPRA